MSRESLPNGVWFSFITLAVIVGLNSCTQETTGPPQQFSGALKQYSEENLKYRGDGKPACNQITFCRSLVEIRCHPELDGPVNYVEVTSGKVLAKCGGFPGIANQTCPPVEWKACMESPTTPH